MGAKLQLSPLQIGIIVLTVATGLIHLIPLGLLSDGDSTVLFILNGLGYLGLLGVLYLPLDFLVGYRSMARWALLGYTIITIIAYFVMNPEPFSSGFGLATKAIEVVLAVLLFMESRQ